MQIITLYRFEREGGGITVSPNKPDCDYTELSRIVADEGMAITKDGENLYSVIDTDVTDGYYEVEIETEETDDTPIEPQHDHITFN